MDFRRFLNRETGSYVFFGVVTSIRNIGLFEVLVFFGVDFRISNIAALLVTKIAAYILNKLFVFRTRCANMGELGKEFFLFTVTRGGTMLVDYFSLILLVSVFHADASISKLFITFIVVVLNYILGKTMVFRKGKQVS